MTGLRWAASLDAHLAPPWMQYGNIRPGSAAGRQGRVHLRLRVAKTCCQEQAQYGSC